MLRAAQKAKILGAASQAGFSNPPKASELRAWAGRQEWTRKPGTGVGGQGPETWVDHTGRVRMKLKHGSMKPNIHPDSHMLHAECRDRAGQRVDLDGNPVTRR